jgi:hypothetical protein
VATDFITCTVASRRYLAQARVVADSFFEHHPEGRFAVLISDDPQRERAVDSRVEELRPADIGVDESELHRLALIYSPLELACALKGRLARHVVQRGETAVLLDGDMLVLGDLTPLAVAARRDGLALTPHSTQMNTPPGCYPAMIGWAPRLRNAFGADQMLVRAGTFNAGLLAVDAGALPFLDWWNDRTARYCLLEPGRGLFVDQGWLALAPTLFDCHVVREPGWNVNGYHLADCDVEWEGDRPRVGGRPIRCFHFITFDPFQPERLSREPNIAAVWPSAADRPGAARLCRQYAARVLAAGHEAAQAEEGTFERLADGTAVDPNMRAVYAEALLRHEAGVGEAPPNPFADGDAEGFLCWLDEPWEGEDDRFPAVSRYLVGFHTRFDWVYGSFKEVPGADAERYLRWLPEAVERGDVDLPERWVPPPVPPPPDPAFLELEDHYRDLLAALEAQRSSLSWRLTAPLRRAVALARRRGSARG